ncbi:Mpo1-like protein [Vibrio marisflavi]|uniref:PRS2 protein n=1 Tax=Vibrio marisflavi CECT 7928 TaxID=634439 RepID=A0ABN8DYB6_9VIBR|nr:Mpo1-like protein [Vibrio marisflavi]CAH0536315.1 hypothetical protein VMF7928_00326 [Vibrio marisflavi CECT 7928]
MKKLTEWLNEYSESHQNRVNKRIHRITAPGVFVMLVGLVWSIPPLEVIGFTVHWVWFFVAGVLVFYSKLSLTVLIMMLGLTLAASAFIWSLHILQVSIFHFSLGCLLLFWLAQFIGYKVEGVMPSLKQRLEFVLIGPVWFLYKN